MFLAVGKAFPWHEVYVPDSKAALDFYTKAFGMGTKEYPMGEMGTYHMLTVDGTPVAGVMSTTEMQMPNVPPQWSVYLAVDDVDKRLKMAKDLGAKVVVEPMDIPSVGRMTLISDPQGAHIWLYKGA
jgi:predicted enzyme related to lactoylglutathione lyase